MADTTYSVVVDYKVHDRALYEAQRHFAALGASAAAHKSQISAMRSQYGSLGSIGTTLGAGLGGMFRGIGGAIDGVTGKIESAAKGAAAFAAVGGGLAAFGLAKSVGSLNRELEDSTIGFGAMLQAAKYTTTWNDSLTTSKALLKAVRADAAALPGETRDLREYLAQALPGAGQSGISLGKLEKLSASAMAASAALGVDFATGSREYGRLMMGGAGAAGAHNILGLKLGISGDEARKFNALGAGARIDYLVKKFSAFDDSIAAYQHSFTGLSSTLADQVKLFASTAASPLFDRVKSVLEDATGWMDRNQSVWMGWATRTGDTLAAGFDRARQIVIDIAPHMKRLAEYAERVATPAHLKTIGAEYAGLKIAGIGAKAAPGLLSAVGGEGALGALGGGAASLAVTGPVAGAVLFDLAAGAVGAYGAVKDLSDVTSRYHNTATISMHGIEENFGKTIASMKSAADSLEQPFNHLAEWMGANLLESIKAVSKVAETAAGNFNRFASTIGSVYEWFNPRGMHDEGKHAADQGYHFKTLAPRHEEDVLGRTPLPKVVNHATHIHSLTVNQTIPAQSDPTRLARKVVDMIHEAARVPTKAVTAQDYRR